MFWYTREVDRNEADAASELAMVKQREQDLMMEVGWGEKGCSLCFACLAAAYSRLHARRKGESAGPIGGIERPPEHCGS